MPEKYFAGDGVKRDADGYYWITGRVDDVLNISGHRLGTAEIESAFVSHKDVSEAAVVGYPHDIKGNGLYCYISVKANIVVNDILKKELAKAKADLSALREANRGIKRKLDEMTPTTVVTAQSETPLSVNVEVVAY